MLSPAGQGLSPLLLAQPLKSNVQGHCRDQGVILDPLAALQRGHLSLLVQAHHCILRPVLLQYTCNSAQRWRSARLRRECAPVEQLPLGNRGAVTAILERPVVAMLSLCQAWSRSCLGKQPASTKTGDVCEEEQVLTQSASAGNPHLLPLRQQLCYLLPYGSSATLQGKPAGALRRSLPLLAQHPSCRSGALQQAPSPEAQQQTCRLIGSRASHSCCLCGRQAVHVRQCPSLRASERLSYFELHACLIHAIAQARVIHMLRVPSTACPSR